MQENRAAAIYGLFNEEVKGWGGIKKTIMHA